MTESLNSTRDVWVARLRVVVWITSILLMLAGFLCPFIKDDDGWQIGVWLMLAGYILFTLSDTGRPVIINLFQEAIEKSKSNGYNHAGYV